ncbi:UNVERIFIED_CONTAM: hypothetical protein GTU68_050895 [Idotea baltica]|nr:hypothetical protein [Idotea baltica]
MQSDLRSRFLIETCDVRGQLVHLDSCWAEARARTDYPPKVSTLLGEAFAASALLAGTIKFDGKLTLQVRGDGDVHLLVVQVTNDGNMRGLARWKGEPTTTVPLEAFGADSRMIITIESEQGAEPYQGIVPLEGESLAESIKHYFAVSEQLKTQVYFSVSDKTVAGMLLQALPPSEQVNEDDDGWARATALADTVTPEELLTTDMQTLLHRLYHEEQVRLFESSRLAFLCSCSKERTDNMLIGLGDAEVQDIVEEQGSVSISCEFCDAQYNYDAVDVAALFKGYVGSSDDSNTQH